MGLESRARGYRRLGQYFPDGLPAFLPSFSALRPPFRVLSTPHIMMWSLLLCLLLRRSSLMCASLQNSRFSSIEPGTCTNPMWASFIHLLIFMLRSTQLLTLSQKAAVYLPKLAAELSRHRASFACSSRAGHHLLAQAEQCHSMAL